MFEYIAGIIIFTVAAYLLKELNKSIKNETLSDILDKIIEYVVDSIEMMTSGTELKGDAKKIMAFDTVKDITKCMNIKVPDELINSIIESKVLRMNSKKAG